MTDEEELVASCGHMERYWKFETNGEAWCILCALNKALADWHVAEADAHQLAYALTYYMNTYPHLNLDSAANALKSHRKRSL